jgi:hypothetical protein
MNKVVRLCSVPECGRTRNTNGWCAVHYQRWLRYGDPLHPVRPYRAISPEDWTALSPDLKPLRDFKPRTVKRPRNTITRSEEQLTCRMCQQEKPGTEFPVKRRVCFACYSLSCKQYHLDNRNRVVTLQKARRYKSTPKAIVAMHADTEVCAICLTTEKLCIDHCHTHGQLRDILCERCNLLIGSVAEDSMVLRRAADYIERHKREHKSA